ncbi:Uncharacterised protein [Dermatophilus congolensis]|uniref:Uncharacterized protein n=2 Tax=Dermatophilus congolensis TaxID=1863 RepID=A0A239VPN7_9MICO|nr:Uncharacterised protein [Dermatophilus congolensis]
MMQSQKIAKKSAGIAFLAAIVVAGVTVGINGVSPDSPGGAVQLVSFVLFGAAVAAGMVYALISAVTKNKSF